MIDYIWTAARLGLSTTFFSIYCTLRGLRDSDKYLKNALVWSKQMMRILHLDLEIIGKENQIKGENYVYVANHSSLLDIPVLLYALNDNVRIIYKKELEKIPIFGLGMKYSPFIAVSREGGPGAMKSLNEAIEAMKEDKGILIYPEGTRSKDGTIGEFKRGAFVMAEKAGKKIIPVTIIGTNTIMPKGKFSITKGVKVKVIISPAMPLPEERHKRAMLAYINEIRDIIVANHEKYA